MSLYKNMNARKAKGISRPKNESTITPEAYKNMQEGFPKKRKKASGGGKQKRAMYYSGGGVKNYKNIKDKVKKCDAKVGLNTMK
jgi:hypothetical protein